MPLIKILKVPQVARRAVFSRKTFFSPESTPQALHTEIQNVLKPLYKQYRSLKYLVAVFHSGSQNLCEATGELLRYNRRLTAEREVLAEKGRALSG